MCVCVRVPAINYPSSLPLLYQYLMDKYCYCFHGNTLPALRSHDLKKKEQEEEEEEEEEKESDTEIIQRDVVEVCQ